MTSRSSRATEPRKAGTPGGFGGGPLKGSDDVGLGGAELGIGVATLDDVAFRGSGGGGGGGANCNTCRIRLACTPTKS